eukprot:UN27933
MGENEEKDQENHKHNNKSERTREKLDKNETMNNKNIGEKKTDENFYQNKKTTKSKNNEWCFTLSEENIHEKESNNISERPPLLKYRSLPIDFLRKYGKPERNDDNNIKNDELHNRISPRLFQEPTQRSFTWSIDSQDKTNQQHNIMELSDTFIAKPYYQHSQITHGRNVHGDPTIIQTTTTYHTTVNSPTSISSVHSDPLNKLTTSPT